MNPPVFEIVKSATEVLSVFGENPTRIYPFGDSPEGSVCPYAVWTVISGSPEIYLNDSPDMDEWVVQMDVYDTTCIGVRTAAEVIRDVLDPVSDIIAWHGESKESNTLLYQYKFDISFFTERE